jgi:hypothetical protein
VLLSDSEMEACMSSPYYWNRGLFQECREYPLAASSDSASPFIQWIVIIQHNICETRRNWFPVLVKVRRTGVS